MKKIYSGIVFALLLVNIMNAGNHWSVVNSKVHGHLNDIRFTDKDTGYAVGWNGTIVDGARVFSLHNYRIAFLVVPIYLIVAIISLYWIKETHHKQTPPSSLP